MFKYTQKDIERFYSKINIIEADPNAGCWDINYYRDKDGYTSFTIGTGNHIGSHRFMYLIWHQDEEEKMIGLKVCHTCDHPWCVNPDHLWLGTNKKNMEDMVNKGRQAKGGRNGNSSLNEDLVEEMLTNILSGYFTSVKEIMKHYDVRNFTVYGILKEDYWTHISENFDMDVIRNKISNVNRPSIRLKDEIVRDIRKRLANKEMPANIARFYDVHDVVISGIKLNRTYKNVI